MIKNIGILAYDGVEAMDYQGPLAIFDLLASDAQGPKPIIVSQKKEFTCSNGRKFQADKTFSCEDSYDLIIIPGGKGVFDFASSNETKIFFDTQYKPDLYLFSICTGSFVLDELKLIGVGDTITTHWEFIHRPLKSGAKMVSSPFEVSKKYNRIWTSGGIFSGIDSSLIFIEQHYHALGTAQNSAEVVRTVGQYFPVTSHISPKTQAQLNAPCYLFGTTSICN
ncbi:MAG: DJ-1/PfpI family protein [Gammaproteobacteria bacterium]